MKLSELNLQVVINDQGETHSIPLGDLTTIGRSVQNRVQIEKSYVSSSHARIERTAAGDYLIEDCGSTNGTFVNDVKLSGPSELKSGDTLRFGLAACKVVAEEEKTQTDLVQEIDSLENSESVWVPMIGIEAIKIPSSNELFFRKKKKSRKSSGPRRKAYLATRKSSRRSSWHPVTDFNL